MSSLASGLYKDKVLNKVPLSVFFFVLFLIKVMDRCKLFYHNKKDFVLRAT